MTDMQSEQTNQTLDLVAMFHTLLEQKWLIIGISFIAAVLSIVIALNTPNEYRAKALLAPEEESDAGLAGLASRFGGLASLAGVNLGKKTLTNPVLALEVIESREFLKTFIEKHNLAVQLIAVESWDEENNLLTIDSDIYEVDTKTWIRSVRAPLKTIPTMTELYEVFMERLTVERNKDNGLVTVAIDYYSPAVAKEWVDWLVMDLNEHMRARDIAQAQKSLNYLNEQVNSTTIANMQEVFYQLIEEQMKTMMLANVRSEYVYKVIDPAEVPEEKVKPKRAVIVILSTMLAGILAIAFVLVRERFSD